MQDPADRVCVASARHQAVLRLEGFVELVFPHTAHQRLEAVNDASHKHVGHDHVQRLASRLCQNNVLRWPDARVETYQPTVLLIRSAMFRIRLFVGRASLVLACLLTPMVLACGAAQSGRAPGEVTRRFSFEFSCPADQVTTTTIENTRGYIVTMGADGCGQRAVYVLNTDTDSWILNSDRPRTPQDSAESRPEQSPRENTPLASAVRACNVGNQPFTIAFGADQQATGIEFSDEVTPVQRSCVARAASEHGHDAERFQWPVVE